MVDFISPIMGCLGVTSYFVTVGRHGHPYLRDGLEWPVEHRIRDPSRSGVSSLHRRCAGSCLSLSPYLVHSPCVSFALSLSSAICVSLSGYTAYNHTTPWYAHPHQHIHTHAHALARAPTLSPSVWALARSLSMTRSHVRSCFVSVLYDSLPLSHSPSRSLAVFLSYFPMFTVSRSLLFCISFVARARSVSHALLCRPSFSCPLCMCAFSSRSTTRMLRSIQKQNWEKKVPKKKMVGSLAPH